MINWIKGAKIQDADIITQGYKIEGRSIVSVLNAENIMKVIVSFVKFHKADRFFFFLEVPCTVDEENQLDADDGELHNNIYYLDNIPADMILEIFEVFEEILVNDGLIAFGAGTHKSEIGKYKYNMVNLYSDDTDNLKVIFNENGIAEQDNLLIPWDIINKNNYGECSAFKNSKGKTIYDIVEILTKSGLYKAETRAR